eukprot:scaffold1060_cov196-Amphora_coffeaeformis.AAC.6
MAERHNEGAEADGRRTFRWRRTDAVQMHARTLLKQLIEKVSVTPQRPTSCAIIRFVIIAITILVLSLIIALTYEKESLFSSIDPSKREKANFYALSTMIRRPQPLPPRSKTTQPCKPILICALLLFMTNAPTEAFVSHPQQSPPAWTEPRPTTTSHSLVPSSVATAVDPRAFSSTAADDARADYTSSLQKRRKTTRGRFAFQDATAVLPLPLERPRAAAHPTTTRQKSFRVYCDLDGVLVDFCHGIRTLFPHHEASQSVDALHRPTMWQKVAEQPSFFDSLPWMPDGQRLWEAIRPLQPDILTGVPYRVTASSVQKFLWCQRELGVPVHHIDKAFGRTLSGQAAHRQKVTRVITTWSNDKHYESGPGAVLIDDRIELKKAWEAKGGIFIHHNGNVDATLQKMRRRGILPPPADNDNLL